MKGITNKLPIPDVENKEDAGSWSQVEDNPTDIAE